MKINLKKTTNFFFISFYLFLNISTTLAFEPKDFVLTINYPADLENEGKIFTITYGKEFVKTDEEIFGKGKKTKFINSINKAYKVDNLLSDKAPSMNGAIQRALKSVQQELSKQNAPKLPLRIDPLGTMATKFDFEDLSDLSLPNSETEIEIILENQLNANGKFFVDVVDPNSLKYKKYFSYENIEKSKVLAVFLMNVVDNNPAENEICFHAKGFAFLINKNYVNNPVFRLMYLTQLENAFHHALYAFGQVAPNSENTFIKEHYLNGKIEYLLQFIANAGEDCTTPPSSDQRELLAVIQKKGAVTSCGTTTTNFDLLKNQCLSLFTNISAAMKEEICSTNLPETTQAAAVISLVSGGALAAFTATMGYENINFEKLINGDNLEIAAMLSEATANYILADFIPGRIADLIYVVETIVPLPSIGQSYSELFYSFASSNIKKLVVNTIDMGQQYTQSSLTNLFEYSLGTNYNPNGTWQGTVDLASLPQFNYQLVNNRKTCKNLQLNFDFTPGHVQSQTSITLPTCRYFGIEGRSNYIELDGINDYIVFEKPMEHFKNLSGNGYNKFSFEAWIKPDTTKHKSMSLFHHIEKDALGQTKGFEIYISEAGSIVLIGFGTSGSTQYKGFMRSRMSVFDGQEHRILVSFWDDDFGWSYGRIEIDGIKNQTVGADGSVAGVQIFYDNNFVSNLDGSGQIGITGDFSMTSFEVKRPNNTNYPYGYFGKPSSIQNMLGTNPYKGLVGEISINNHRSGGFTTDKTCEKLISISCSSSGLPTTTKGYYDFDITKNPKGYFVNAVGSSPTALKIDARMEGLTEEQANKVIKYYGPPVGNQSASTTGSSLTLPSCGKGSFSIENITNAQKAYIYWTDKNTIFPENLINADYYDTDSITKFMQNIGEFGIYVVPKDGFTKEDVTYTIKYNYSDIPANDLKTKYEGKKGEDLGLEINNGPALGFSFKPSQESKIWQQIAVTNNGKEVVAVNQKGDGLYRPEPLVRPVISLNQMLDKAYKYSDKTRYSYAAICQGSYLKVSAAQSLGNIATIQWDFAGANVYTDKDGYGIPPVFKLDEDYYIDFGEDVGRKKIALTLVDVNGLTARKEFVIDIIPEQIVDDIIETNSSIPGYKIYTAQNLANVNYTWDARDLAGNPVEIKYTDNSLTNEITINWGARGGTVKVNGILNKDLEGCSCLIGTKTFKVDPPVLVSAKLLLEGLYDYSSDKMTNNLSIKGILPNVSPFDNKIVTNMPTDAVEWVNVELLTSPRSSTPIEKISGILKSDGWIVSAEDGVSPLIFRNIPKNIENVYIKIETYAKNHLTIISQNQLTLNKTGGYSLYDFTLDINNAFKDGIGAPTKPYGFNKYVVRVGDIAHPIGKIDNRDLQELYKYIPNNNPVELGNYNDSRRKYDLNYDNVLDLSDLDIMLRAVETPIVNK